MGDSWVPLLAEVEWRGEGRGFERPVALRVGGERRPLDVASSWVEGAEAAGGRELRFFLADDGEGRRVRIRVGVDGRARVELRVGR